MNKEAPPMQLALSFWDEKPAPIEMCLGDYSCLVSMQLYTFDIFYTLLALNYLKISPVYASQDKNISVWGIVLSSVVATLRPL